MKRDFSRIFACNYVFFREKLCLEWGKLRFLFMLKILEKSTFVILESFKRNRFAFGGGEQNYHFSQILNQ
jgi:hypothetical protein